MLAKIAALFFNLNFKYPKCNTSKLHYTLGTRKVKFRGTSGIPDAKIGVSLIIPAANGTWEAAAL